MKKYIWMLLLCPVMILAQNLGEKKGLTGSGANLGQQGLSIPTTSIWQMTIDASTNPSIVMRGTGYITVKWGDGTSTAYTLTGSDQTVSHTYTGGGAGTIVKIYNKNKITKFSTSSNCNWSFNWSVIPASMTNFSCTGSNTLSGTLSLPASMTNFSCTGSNTLSGTLSLPASMIYFNCTGPSTLSGTLSLPASMTYFVCYGSGTLSGTLSLPASMTYFDCRGSNTLSGTLSLPASMTNFVCRGSNTLSGTLSLPASMTNFDCQGSNTLSGTLSLPASITSFVCQGSNTLSGYSTQSFSNNMNYFNLITNNGTGFTAAQIDQLCIDLDGSAWAGGGRALTLIGSKIAAPTSTSAAARTDLSTVKSVTVTTN